MLVRFQVMRLALVVLLLGLTAVACGYFVAVGRLAAAKQLRRDDNYELAEDCLARCWRLPGLMAALSLEEQLMAVQQGDLSDEVSLQKQVAKRSSASSFILEALAKAKLATFQWIEAEKYAQSILDQQPLHAQALWLRGQANVEMQREVEARQDFERAIEIAPDDSRIRLSLAHLLLALGYVRSAMEQFENIAQANAGDEHTILGLARCLQEESRWIEARKLLDEMVRVHPKSLAVLVDRGRLALRTGDSIAAEGWLRRAIELSPDHADANLVLKQVLQSQQKNDTVLDKRIENNERVQAELKLRLHDSQPNAPLLAEVGRWMARTGQEEEAAGWFFSALKLDSAYAPAHKGLADFFAHTGQTRRANRHGRLGGALTDRGMGDGHETREPPGQESQRIVGSLQLGAPTDLREASSEEVHRLCAACHSYPPPETMPRSAWRKEVKQGYDFLHTSALKGDFPSLESVVLYYERRAPESLPRIERSGAIGGTPVKFEKRGTGWLPRIPPHPAVANANLARLFGHENQELLLCETRLDSILVLRPYDQSPGGMVLRQVTAPCHSSVCDLDGDGNQDMLVASLGNFFPTNDKVGKVLWLRNKGGGQFESQPILEGVGRVADVQSADFNGDSRLDLIVAVFGWRTGGQILFLENRTSDWSRPQFDARVIDQRHGAIHVPVVDLNGDRRPDFVSLISQEHESVVAYLNLGNGEFQHKPIFTAPHPTYGCSGIDVVDVDGDRDSDVVLTNGDILDRPYLLKPYHGVQWLENEGRFPFKHHAIAAMYGVSRAVAADFDQDGDQDVAAVSLLPQPHFPDREKLQLPSVVLFEQTAKKQFAMHTLETGSCDHFSCSSGDWDNDGLIDLAVANFSWNDSQSIQHAATLWRNAGKP